MAIIETLEANKKRLLEEKTDLQKKLDQFLMPMGQVAAVGQPVTPEQFTKMNRQDFVNLINRRMYRMHNELRRRYNKTPYDYED